MKAILVVEIDDNHLVQDTNDLYERMKGRKCELRPVPSEYCTSGHNPEEMWFHGYNRAIRDIVGENNVGY